MNDAHLMQNMCLSKNFLHLEDNELDQHIYRIMKEHYVIKMFQDNENVLSQVQNWKDKFENFQLNLGGILNGEPFTYSFRDDFVGQCWTREYLSEAMWGIYANDPEQRYLRIRSTPRKLLTSLAEAHPKMPHETCFVGKVLYKKEGDLETYVKNGGELQLQSSRFAESLLLKRRAFKHEREVRLVFFGDTELYDTKGLYRYGINPHSMITQIMADPNRDRNKWTSERLKLQAATGFRGGIKRSKIYDAPAWASPSFGTQKAPDAP